MNQNERLLNALGTAAMPYLAAADPALPRPRMHRVRAAVWLAAVLLLVALLVTGTVASARYDLGFYLSTVFGDRTEGLGEITAQPRGVSYRTTNEAVRFDLVGVTGDRHNAYVFLEMTLPEDAVMPTDSVALVFDGFIAGPAGEASESRLAMSTHTRMRGEGQERVFGFGFLMSWPDTTMIGVSWPNTSIIGRRTYVALRDVRVEAMDGSEIYFAEGEWELTFTLNQPDRTESFTPSTEGITIQGNEDAQSLGTGEILPVIAPDTMHVDLSPISLTLKMTYTAERQSYFAAPREMTLVMKDGTTVTESFRGASHGWEGSGGTVIVTLMMTEPIDPREVVALRYGGAEIALK